MKDNSLSLPSPLPLHVRENYSRTHELAAHYPQQGEERLLKACFFKNKWTWTFFFQWPLRDTKTRFYIIQLSQMVSCFCVINRVCTEEDIVRVVINCVIWTKSIYFQHRCTYIPFKVKAYET